MGAAVCTAGGSVVPVGGVLYPQARVVTRAKPRTSSKGLAMRKATGGSSAPWKNGWGPGISARSEAGGCLGWSPRGTALELDAAGQGSNVRPTDPGHLLPDAIGRQTGAQRGGR